MALTQILHSPTKLGFSYDIASCWSLLNFKSNIKLQLTVEHVEWSDAVS